MRVNITARHGKMISERMRTHVNAEIEKLDKFYEGIIGCDVVLDSQKMEQTAEVLVSIHGHKLTAIEHSDDIYKSIDAAVAKLERQLKKVKAKLHHYENKRFIEEVKEAV